METDEVLLRRVEEQDQDAFEMLLNRYSERVYKSALRITRNVEDAEEVLQDVFVLVYRKAHMFQGVASVSSWIYSITRNSSLYVLRRRTRLPDLSLLEPEETYETEAVFEIREAIEAALTFLHPIDRRIFVLCTGEGQSNAEAGRQTALTTLAVKARCQRARRTLRRKLQGFYSEFRGGI